MFWTILHRMIFLELVRIFVLALLGLTGILVMAGIVAEASQQGLGPAQVLAVIPLLIPSTLPYTIPATTLFATCLVYGRLAHDNEILAIKAAGINVLHVVLPGAFLGLIMSVATFANRVYTPLAFREETERWVVGVLATIVAVVWVVVIPLELVMHEHGNAQVAAQPKPAGPHG